MRALLAFFLVVNQACSGRGGKELARRLAYVAAPLLAVLLVPAPELEGQTAGTQVTGYLVAHFDPDSSTPTGCRVQGTGTPPQPVNISAPVKTTGSSVTIAAVTAGTNPFSGLAVGDALVLRSSTAGSRPVLRSIITYTSADSVDVDTAIDVGTSSSASYLKQTCTTGNEAGWSSTSGLRNISVQVQIAQQNTTTGIDVTVECRADVAGSLPVQVYPDNSTGAAKKTYTTADLQARTIVSIQPWVNCGQIRVLISLNSTDDGTDTGVNRELVDAYLTGDRR